ncbi:hypothetical protein [Amycolatopsis aidingensis]|uniref:hypothetical protein n=1 Tax=Amycolatopsis aidingensis TaxID=2842453 RepID=UPI001C0D479B|nr:hypothetical protein [Amycolatopsis aidingensis]
MRYGYFAFDHRKTSVHEVDLAQIGFAELNHALGGDQRFTEGLRPWGIDLLRTGRHEAGLFTFVYAETDELGTMGRSIAELEIAWNGRTEIPSGAQGSIPALNTAR